MSPAETLLERLAGAGCKPERTGRGWLSRCPAHFEFEPSLKLEAAADGGAVLKCGGGCTAAAVAAALGLTLGDLFNPADRTAPSRAAALAEGGGA